MNTRSLMLTAFWLLLTPLVSLGATVGVTKTADYTTRKSGDNITFTINYTCPGVTENCLNVVIRDILPAQLEYVDILGSGDTQSAAYSAATRTATWTMKTPLAAGTTGQVALVARFPNKITPNGTVASNQASISASNAAPVSSNIVQVTAQAASNVAFDKVRSSGITALNQNVVYRLRTGTANVSGILNWENAVLTDTIPTGAVFVSASAGYALNGNTVTWNLGTLTSGANVADRLLVLNYPSPPFSLNNSVTNNAALTGTPVGATAALTLTGFKTDTLGNPTTIIMANDSKLNSNASPKIGASVQYRFEFQNNGSYPYDSLTIVDNIPAQLNVTSIRVGRQDTSSTPFGGAIGQSVEYQTNLNANWTVVSGSPFATSATTNVAVSSLPLITNEWITALRYSFQNVPVGFIMTDDNNASGYAATVLGTDRGGNPIVIGQQIVNTGAYTATRAGFADIVRSRSSTVTVAADATLPQPRITKTLASGYGSIYNPGELVRYELTLQNQAAAGSALANPVIADLLNAGQEYQDGSWAVATRPTGMPDPVFEKLTNYDGSGRTLLRWRWETPSAYSLPINASLKIRFDARIKGGTLPGTIGNVGNLIAPASTVLNTSGCQSTVADSNDLNANGSRSELLCTSSNLNVTVNSLASLAAVKQVKGQLDADFHAYPQSGRTVVGGSLEYRFTVTNTGNLSMTKGFIDDILPFVGDTGAVDTSPRLSQWRPQLTAPVATPTGVVVYYSVQGNPCRPDMNPVQPSDPNWPVGCVAPDWLVLPPDDITTVQSLRFDFGDVVLAPQQSFTFNFPLQAPLGAPTNSEIAWNSFGYHGEVVGSGAKVLPSEPVKVGIAIEAPQPAHYGDYVWIDADRNGIQNAGELGLNGVRVDLYQDNGDGIADINSDTYIGFRLTSGDASGNAGHYQFTNLAVGDYYAKFTRPPGYSITEPNQGGNPAIDSDADKASGLTAITQLALGEIDFSWDMGVYPATTAEMGNYVWFDRNADGIQNEATLDGLNGITVNLFKSDNTLADSTTTANDINGNPGYYRFTGLLAGQGYYVEFVLPADASFSPQNQGGIGALDSDAAPSTGKSAVFTLAAGAYDSTWDAGIQMPMGAYSLGDRIWFDGNGNGLYEPFSGEDGFDGVRVNLYRDDGDGVFGVGDTYYSATTTFTSNGKGYYGFAALPAGGWIIQIPPAEFAPAGLLRELTVSPVRQFDPSNNIDSDNNGYPVAGSSGHDMEFGAVTWALILGPPSSYPDSHNPSLDIGLMAGLPTMTLTPTSALNTVCTGHTVSATVMDFDGDEPVVGQEVAFTVTAGPNTGRTGTAITNANGVTSFTWTGTGGVGLDYVVGTFQFADHQHVTAEASKEWQLPTGGVKSLPVCDADGDQDIDKADYNLVVAARNSSASGLCDQRDADHNGLINLTDAKICIQRCTRPSCANQ